MSKVLARPPETALERLGVVRSVRSERLQVILKQLQWQRLVPRPAPAIALNAADEPLAVVVDLDERPTTLSAMSNTRKSEVRMGGPDSSETGYASSSEWVRIVGNTVIYPSIARKRRKRQSQAISGGFTTSFHPRPSVCPLTQKLLMADLAVSAALGAQARDAVAYPGGVCAAGLRVAF
jgi:hypothetical protein